MFGLFEKEKTPSKVVSGKVLRFGTFKNGEHSEYGGYTVLIEGQETAFRFFYPHSLLQSNRQFVELTQPGDEVALTVNSKGRVESFENKMLDWYDHFAENQ